MENTINSYSCKYCGYRKFYHSYPPAKRIEYPIIKGYRKSLDNCPGFSLSKKDLTAMEKEEKNLKKLGQAFMDSIDIREKINDEIGKHW